MRSKITREQYQEIADRSSAARYFLENARFLFIRDYLGNAKSSVEQSILKNTIKEVHEQVSIGDKILKTFITPKKEQVDELSGQYKFIEQFLADMTFFSTEKELIDTAIAKGQVVLEGGKDVTG